MNEWERTGEFWKKNEEVDEELDRRYAAVIMDRLNWSSVLISVINDLDDMIHQRDYESQTEEERREIHEVIVEICHKVLPILQLAAEDRNDYSVNDLVKEVLRRAHLAIPEINEDAAKANVIFNLVRKNGHY